MKLSNKLLKPFLTLLAILAFVLFLPNEPTGPWNLFNPKKIATIIFALTLIQAMGSFMIQLLGSRTGSLLTGFLGGLISSTATTATLAKKSKDASGNNVTTEVLTYLSATVAMLMEGATILLFSTKEVHASLLLIFIGPILLTLFMIFLLSKKQSNHQSKMENVEFEILPILKLSIFIIVILLLSKVLINLFDQSGLLILTFVVSLFEIHGSVIANVQLHDTGALNVSLLGSLLSISVLASYLSKLFLVYTVGSAELSKIIVKYTGILILSLVISWLIFIALA